MKDWRIIEWHSDQPSYYWRIFRYADGSAMEFDTEDEARVALHLLRENHVDGRFRIHQGALTMAAIRAQGHRIMPPKDLLARMLRARMTG